MDDLSQRHVLTRPFRDERANNAVTARIRAALGQTRLYAEFRYLYRWARIVLTRGAFLRAEQRREAFSWDLLPDSERRYDRLFSRAEQNFADIVSPYTGEFTWFSGRVHNGVFMSQDVELLYSMIRFSHPRLVIEIGSGHSTWFTSRALLRNGSGRIVSIDPAPRRSLPSPVEYLGKTMADVGDDVYASLGPGDVLFLDAWHTRDIATYYTRRIFPLLRSGVLIHIHDIAYPFVPPWEEEPVVLEFFHTHAAKFDIITGCAYVTWKAPALVQELIPSHRWCPTRPGTSLWARKH